MVGFTSSNHESRVGSEFDLGFGALVDLVVEPSGGAARAAASHKNVRDAIALNGVAAADDALDGGTAHAKAVETPVGVIEGSTSRCKRARGAAEGIQAGAAAAIHTPTEPGFPRVRHVLKFV